MVSASGLLLLEGTSQSHETVAADQGLLLECGGCAFGMVFIILSKRWLDHHHELKFNGIDGASRCVLVFCRCWLSGSHGAVSHDADTLRRAGASVPRHPISVFG